VCDCASVEDVAAQLLRQLPLADAEVRGELVVKVAILAERYAPSLVWCAAALIRMLRRSRVQVH
jgi:AP-2 complex subunit alpha